MPDTAPTTPGPSAHPTSPARANNANMAVPPSGQCTMERLNVPGHRMPTEKPHSAQPASESSGQGANTAAA